MEQNIKIRIAGGLTLVALVIGLSIVTSASVASRAYERRGQQTAEQTQQLTVRGSARQRITSDLAVWTVRVRGSGPTIPAAFTVLEDASTQVSKFLSTSGFPSSEIELSAIDTTTLYKRNANGNETREIDSFSMDRTFTITTPNVARVAAASTEVTQLLKHGIEVSTQRPAYYYTKLADLRISILGDASQDARSRADEMTSKTGSKITTLRSIQTGPIQLTVPNSTDVSGYGAYDTSTIEKDASVTVTANFGISG
jgi:hypothetical protein